MQWIDFITLTKEGSPSLWSLSFYDKKQREGENDTLSLTDTLVDDILFFSAAVATKKI